MTEPKEKPYAEPVTDLGKTLEVSAIAYAKESKLYQEKDLLGLHEPGSLVKVRPVGKRFGDGEKTYLGILLGNFAQGVAFGYDPDAKCLYQKWTGHNPAIFVPALKTVVYGYESWWGEIKSEDDLKDITDDDISNVWYVKALREGLKKEEEKAGHA